MRHFFDTNTLPRCVNITRIALVPKIESPTTMNDFKPISCYNMMYKCISKVIISRLKGIFPDVIGFAQTTFVPSRQISNTILLTQELIHKYHLANLMPKYALKIDIRKAFNMVS